LNFRPPEGANSGKTGPTRNGPGQKPVQRFKRLELFSKPTRRPRWGGKTKDRDKGVKTEKKRVGSGVRRQRLTHQNGAKGKPGKRV